MKTPVIDSACMAANDGIYPELKKITGINRPGEWTEINALAELLKPLNLDYKTSEKIMHQAILATAAEGRKAFRNGFRLAARLMVESLGAPEGPETGGGA